MPIIKTSGWYASNLQKGNLSKYQTMSLTHNSTVSDIPLHFQGNTIESSGNNNNNNKLYLHDHNKVLQYCKSYLKLLIDSL